MNQSASNKVCRGFQNVHISRRKMTLKESVSILKSNGVTRCPLVLSETHHASWYRVERSLDLTQHNQRCLERGMIFLELNWFLYPMFFSGIELILISYTIHVKSICSKQTLICACMYWFRFTYKNSECRTLVFSFVIISWWWHQENVVRSCS
jgi:hypothetical protein